MDEFYRISALVLMVASRTLAAINAKKLLNQRRNIYIVISDRSEKEKVSPLPAQNA